MLLIIRPVTALIVSVLISQAAMATPSGQIWIPSTDIQTTGVIHLGFDNYSAINTPMGTAPSTGASNYYDFGITYGALPGLEIGYDFISVLQYPSVFNIKYAVPEGSLPFSVAVGGYNVGFVSTDAARGIAGNDLNIMYGVIAKNIEGVARFSAGYYSANPKNMFFDTAAAVNGKNLENSGLLLSIDRQLNDKWWVAADYQGGYNYFGSLNLGMSYAFSPNTSVIFGYNIYTLPGAATGGNTITTQVDINI